MLRFTGALLAKKKQPPPSRRKVLKRGARRSSSSGKPSSSKGTKAANTTKTAEDTTHGSGALMTAVGSTHVDPQTQLPRMVDITTKRPTYRFATAVATVIVPAVANALLEDMKQTLTPAVRKPQESGSACGHVSQMEEYYTSKKGPLFATAVIAGTTAVKQSSMLIPFCHPIPIQKCSFTFRRRVVSNSGGVRPSSLPHRVVLRKRSSPPSPLSARSEYSILYCFCTVATDEYKTGVEMEALTGATVASITLYDMLKGLPSAQEDGLGLGEAFVLAKRGGKNDFIKLLMSEPDKPPEGRSETAQLTALGARDTSTLPPPSAAPEDGSKEADGAGAEEGRYGPQLVRRSVAGEGSGAPGDSGAWWHTSRHERRVHEQYQRRKYGSDARLTDLTVIAGKKRNSAGQHAGSVTEADADQAGEEVAEEEAAPATAPRSGRGHVTVRHVTSAKSKLAARIAKKVQEDEEEEAEAEDEEAEVHATTPTRRKGKAPSGQNVKKTGRAPPPAAATPADEVEEEEEEEEEVLQPDRGKSSKKPTKPAKGKQRNAVVVEEEEYEEDDASEIDEEEETAQPATKGRRGTAAKKATPPRRRGGHTDDEEYEEENDDVEVPIGWKSNAKGKKGGMRPVDHDAWDNQTVVSENDDAEETEVPEEEEEEAPPPPPPKKKLKKKLRR